MSTSMQGARLRSDAETLSLLTSRRVPNPSTSHSGPSQGPSSAPSGIRPAEPVQHASHVSHGCNVPVQHDIDAQNAPSQAATKKRPLPQSFKPVSRLGFKPPRANYAAGQPSSNGVKPSPPLNRQLAPSNSSWPLALRSTNQQQSAAHQAKAAALSPASKQTPQANRASHSNAAKQAPQPNPGFDRWLGQSPGSAKLGQGKPKHLAVLAARPGTGPTSSAILGRASDELYFSAAGAQQPVRLCTIPDVIEGGAAEYANAWIPAVYEELNLQLRDMAKRFHAIYSQAMQQAGKDASKDAVSSNQLQPCMRKAGLKYYTDCEFTMYNKKQRQLESSDTGLGVSSSSSTMYLTLTSGRGSSTEYRRDQLWVVGSMPELARGPQIGVGDRLNRPWCMVVRSCWHGPNHEGRFEVEALCPVPQSLRKRQPCYALQGPEAATELQMIAALRSLSPDSLPLLPSLLGPPLKSAWPHAPIDPQSLQPASASAPGLQSSQSAASATGSMSPSTGEGSSQRDPRHEEHSMKSGMPDTHHKGLSSPSQSPRNDDSDFEVAGKQHKSTQSPDDKDDSHFTEADIQQRKATQSTDGRGSQQATPEDRVDADCIIQRFGLNAEQAVALRAMEAWTIQGASQVACPMCVVHGPFGTGKSMLLVAAIHLFLGRRSGEGPLKGCRVAVAAHTNAAVDRVMCGLLQSGVTDMIRVGPLRRIDRTLLGHSLHSNARNKSEAAHELEEMLRQSTSISETAVLKAELAQVKAGAEKARKRKLKTAAVVGVTCCSAGMPLLDGQRLDIVVLDECSQMVEPLSLVPLLRAGCRFAILAGDPMQLPPLIANPSQTQQHPGAPTHGLPRPLFTRLMAAGHAVHMLRRQYRCHPSIAGVSNHSFYGGRLLDGCTAADRGALLSGLPPVLCLDVRGSQQYTSGSGSASNQAEARAVVQMVGKLLGQQNQSGSAMLGASVPSVSPGDIGIICFHRAQVALITGMLPDCGRNCNREAEQLRDGLPEQLQDKITVATVDSYQGLEKPVIILSTAVTRPGNFVGDGQRLNVALTRAKHHLIVVGHVPALQESSAAFASLFRQARSSPGAYRAAGAF